VAGVQQIGSTSLSAASAMAASNNFFDNPPQRVNGPPFDAATSLVAGTSANTVSWYTGGDTAGSIRATQTARIDSSTSVSYGTQANEQGIRWVVQNIATLAATSYSPSDTNAAQSYTALNQRIYSALAVPSGVQSVSDIEASLANAQTAMQSAQSQHQTTSNTVTNLLQSIEGVNTTEIGAQILSLQTALSASLETTARLSQINLLSYLSPVTG
jgi:flagellar hook-associated protein 3 FlgL